MKRTRVERGITLIALIITIVILLILASVAISSITNDGILSYAENAAKDYNQAVKNEQLTLEGLMGFLDAKDAYNEEEGVNTPLMKTGMTPVKYDETNNCWVVTTADDAEWYDYENKKWANVMLQDGLEYDSNGKVTSEGSMFVWIPRFAYKITNQLTRANYSEGTATISSTSYTVLKTTSAGTIDVKFLQGTGDNYEGGKAVRSNTSTINYVVHPSFTSNVNLGGWSNELTGYWVAKYEAGYAGEAGKPSSAQDSTVSYTENYGYNGATSSYGHITNNYYGSNQIKNGEAYQKIKYPTFTKDRSSFNYITIADSYSLCLALNDNGNPYGINSNSDTHLMKNSEWGAVAYLTHSKYGRNGTEVSINDTQSVSDANVNSERTVWASTGGSTSRSSTGNETGIYDLSGGLWERVASYVNNGNSNITTYGNSLKTNASTKYVTLYNVGESDNRVYNWIAAKQFYGDAVTETSLFDETKTGTDNASIYYNYYTGWFSDYSDFPVGGSPFFERGGAYWGGSYAGSFAFYGASGFCVSIYGFRAVLV